MVEWLTPAYRQVEKSKGWYALMGLIILLFVAYGLFYDGDGWAVSVAFLVLAAVYYATELKSPPIVKVSISELGIRFGVRFFYFTEIKTFWMTSGEIRNLHLMLHKGTQRHIVIPLPLELNLLKIREFLRTQIEEEEGRKESFTDQLIHNLGL